MWINIIVIWPPSKNKTYLQFHGRYVKQNETGILEVLTHLGVIWQVLMTSPLWDCSFSKKLNNSRSRNEIITDENYDPEIWRRVKQTKMLMIFSLLNYKILRNINSIILLHHMVWSAKPGYHKNLLVCSKKIHQTICSILLYWSPKDSLS